MFRFLIWYNAILSIKKYYYFVFKFTPMETKVASTTLSEQEIQNIYDYAVMLIGNGQSNAEVSSIMISRGIASADAPGIAVTIRQQIAQSK